MDPKRYFTTFSQTYLQQLGGELSASDAKDKRMAHEYAVLHKTFEYLRVVNDEITAFKFDRGEKRDGFHLQTAGLISEVGGRLKTLATANEVGFAAVAKEESIAKLVALGYSREVSITMVDDKAKRQYKPKPGGGKGRPGKGGGRGGGKKGDKK
jgi:hypothetical protein